MLSFTRKGFERKGSPVWEGAAIAFYWSALLLEDAQSKTFSTLGRHRRNSSVMPMWAATR